MKAEKEHVRTLTTRIIIITHVYNLKSIGTCRYKQYIILDNCLITGKTALNQKGEHRLDKYL